VRTLEAGPQLVVGVVMDPRLLDQSGWTARLQVEQALAGPAQPGQSLQIGWEELARSRPPRFEAGRRVVVALVPLPTSSLWRQRFPTPGVLAVAGDGQAFLREPDAATLSLLERWSKIGTSERDGPAGVAALAALWAGAAPPVAQGALARLAEIPGLDGKVYGEGASMLASGLASPSRSLPLREGVIRLAGERRLFALQPTLESFSRRGDPLEAPALDALGKISLGLPPDRVRNLLSRPEAAIRVVGVRWARGPLLEAVSMMVKADISPEVRAAAVVALFDQQGMTAFDVAAQGLFDPDPAVRAAAARRIGELGPPAVPGLLALLQARAMPEAAALIAALSLAGNEGLDAVQSIAATHPDEKVRAAARLALGKLGGGR